MTERINQRLGGKPPAGAIYHAEGPTDAGGWWVVDVWTSEEAFQTFRQEILQPVLDDVNALRGEVRQLQVQWESSQMQTGS